MNFTKLNLKDDVQDSAQDFGLSPNLEARFASGQLELEHGGLGYEKLAPGFRVPFGHTHADQEEVYVVVSGGGRVKVDDEILEIRQWDAIRVPAGAMRNFEAGPDGCELLAFGAPKMDDPRAGSTLEQGWWSD